MLLQLAVLYIIVSIINILTPDNAVFLIRNGLTIVLMGLSLSLTQYFSDSIIDRHTRRYLVGVAWLITLWIVFRGAKYIAFAETDVIARHLWYMYYIPALFIPLFSLFAAQSVGANDEFRLRWKHAIVIGVTFILAILVLTNDLHQLVFRFQPGFEDWDAHYNRAPMHYLVYTWIVLLYIGAIYILFKKCRVSINRRLVWVPILPLLFGICYTALYAVDAWPSINGELFGEFPEAICFTVAGISLSLIYIGLIPSNEGYSSLFEQSKLAAQIADQHLNVIYKSMNAAPLTQEQLATPSSILLDRDTRLHRNAITGGFVYWQDDISALNRINEELQENGELLAEEAELLRLQNELKEERAKIDAKMKIYDDIAQQTASQQSQIRAIVDKIEQNTTTMGEEYNSNIKIICLLAVYIKRYANLALLSADKTAINSQELALAIRESLRSLHDIGVKTEESLCDDFLITTSCALSTYIRFEQLLEAALPSLRGIQVLFANGALKLMIEGAEIQLPDDAGMSITTEDHISYIKILLVKAGDRA